MILIIERGVRSKIIKQFTYLKSQVMKNGGKTSTAFLATKRPVDGKRLAVRLREDFQLVGRPTYRRHPSLTHFHHLVTLLQRRKVIQ